MEMTMRAIEIVQRVLGHAVDVPDVPDLAKISALLDYMTDHNRQHAAEVGDFAHQLYHAGKENAAQLLEKAVERHIIYPL